MSKAKTKVVVCDLPEGVDLATLEDEGELIVLIKDRNLIGKAMAFLGVKTFTYDSLPA